MITDEDSANGLLRGVTISLESHLTQEDIEYIWESIDAGERVIALEDLCTQLYEHDAKLGRRAYEDLAELGRFYGISASLWEVLQPEA